MIKNDLHYKCFMMLHHVPLQHALPAHMYQHVRIHEPQGGVWKPIKSFEYLNIIYLNKDHRNTEYNHQLIRPVIITGSIIYSYYFLFNLSIDSRPNYFDYIEDRYVFSVSSQTNKLLHQRYIYQYIMSCRGTYYYADSASTRIMTGVITPALALMTTRPYDIIRSEEDSIMVRIAWTNVTYHFRSVNSTYNHNLQVVSDPSRKLSTIFELLDIFEG